MRKYLGQNLLYLRRLKGWQQAEIQKRLGIKASTWGNYENDVSQPNLDVLISIAKFFGITETDLLHTDLEANAHLIPNNKDQKKQDNSHPIPHQTTHPITKKEPKKPVEYNFEMDFNQSLNEDKTPYTLEERMADFIAEMQKNEAKNAKRIAELEGKINALAKTKGKK